jgi:hypothetical protein
MEKQEVITIWTEVVRDILNLAPPSARQGIIDQLVEEQKQRLEDRKAGTLRVITIDQLKDDPGMKYCNEIMEAMSTVVQSFVRIITNDHSREDAARILFRWHRDGHGSGLLADYLDGLPGIKLTADAKRMGADT